MQSFTIRDIENLTGIKAHTLRVWEQRYNFFSAKRKQSLHRFYDNEDLKILLRVSLLYHMGWKVSKIASITPNQVIEEISKLEIPDKRHFQMVSRLIEAALDFDEITFVNMIDQISAKIGFERCVTEVCYPYLKKIGMLWSTNHVIPAQEHFSSYIVQNKIIVETDKLPSVKHSPEILLICPKGEFHELPLLFINYLLKKNSWSTVYLGTNIPKGEVNHFANVHSIQYLYLHLITNFTGFHAEDYVEDICLSFPGKKIIASGTGIHGVQRNFVNLTLLRNDREIMEFIQIKSNARGS